MEEKTFKPDIKIPWNNDLEINFMPGTIDIPTQRKRLVKDQAEMDEDLIWNI